MTVIEVPGVYTSTESPMSWMKKPSCTLSVVLLVKVWRRVISLATSLVPGGAVSSLESAEGQSNAEKALALWPAEVGKAYLAMPEDARCRGFMF